MTHPMRMRLTEERRERMLRGTQRFLAEALDLEGEFYEPERPYDR